MVCRACGAPVPPGGAFCPRCAWPIQPPDTSPPPAPIFPVPPPLAEQRVARHLQTLGILWLVYGAYRAITGILAVLFLLGITSHVWLPGWHGWGGIRIFPFLPYTPWLASVAGMIAVLTTVMAVISGFTGFSLIARKSWGRTLATIMGILILIRIPLGTALGIYTLWVLAPAASAAEYEALADRS